MKQIIICAFAVAAGLASCATDENRLTLSGLNPENFKAEVDGKSTALYTLVNSAGMEAAVTNYGGRLVSLMVPDRDGTMRDVVLGHDSVADYINIDGNFGALIGRYGNRIDQGRFSIDSTVYQLPQNNFGHCLHGGPKGFHHSVWDASQPNDSTLVLTLSSPDGEAGFPGNIDVKVTYSLTADNALDISYEATTDKPTILNLTNHSYFNLSGDPSQDVLCDTVWFNASAITPIDSTFMTTGELMPVEGTVFDFRNGRTLEEGIASADPQIRNGLGYDHNMVLDTGGDINTVAAKVTDPRSGIVMEVYTTEPGIQFYSGNFLDGKVRGKGGVAYPRRSAMCLESQHYPDSPNKPQWPSVVVCPGEKYTSRCIYKFTTAAR
ncbi:MAG: galactose mutarotase [Muribaculaceae bacterium]|nr:galactose mutarotase [Muribaculaceae bacterium]